MPPMKKNKHPGRVYFIGRWRTPEECALRIMNDPLYRGFTWFAVFENNEQRLRGSKGSCAISLKCNAVEVLSLHNRDIPARVKTDLPG